LVDAQTAMASGDHELAIETYDEVLELEPSNTEAVAYRSWNLYLSGDIDAARDGLDEAVALDETYPDALAFRAILNVRSDQARAGLDDLLALQALEPGEGVAGFIVPTAFEAADALLLTRDVDGVLRAYTLVLEREPGNVAALAQRGWILGQAEIYDRSLEDLDAAAAADPASAVTLAFRAAIRARSGDLDGAAADIAAFDALDAPPPEAVDLVDQVRTQLDP
jgi:tetratricopeptide (TPR) repeat protein